MAMLVLCGCSNNKKSVENSATGSDVNSQEEYSMQVTDNQDASDKEEYNYNEQIAEKVTKSDGVLEEMSIGKLTKKLSKLNKKTTMTDLIDIFGKAPHMVIEADSNLFEYTCGDVKISLWGADLNGGTLFQVIVDNNDSGSSNDSGFTIDLPKEKAE